MSIFNGQFSDVVRALTKSLFVENFDEGSSVNPIPNNAILQENLVPILQENGNYLLEG